MSLAMACDLITAGRSARFVMAYVKVGLSPDGGGSWFATRALPKQSAAELMLEGGAWTAERLHALGDAGIAHGTWPVERGVHAAAPSHEMPCGPHASV